MDHCDYGNVMIDPGQEMVEERVKPGAKKSFRESVMRTGTVLSSLLAFRFYWVHNVN